MNLPHLAVKRPITTIMMLVCILVIGTIAVTKIKLAFLPEVDAPFIDVQIPYPNSIRRRSRRRSPSRSKRRWPRCPASRS